MGLALYPGTFDPLHNGHIDIARRAVTIFGQLLIGVYAHPRKVLTFPLEERVELVRAAFAGMSNVQVEGYEGLTVNLAAKHDARVIVRGLRAISDFELEYQMAMTTRKLAPGMDMICLMTSLEYAFISSSVVKEIAMAGGCVRQMVPEHVADHLARRLKTRTS